MSEGLSLVTELAIILIAAGVFTVISKALKQPLILGYIVAGFLVGPSLGIFPQFSTESVKQWSEIGIIFLLFNLGLEFSFKKLLKVGSAALITAGTICVGMFVMGMLTGSAMGWTSMESIFLGGLLSMSSTTIIIKAYDDMGLKSKPYASLIFGSLVFEDLIAVLMLVLLSTMAVSNKFAGGEMLMALGKLAFFLVLCFLVGIYIIPTLFRKARAFISDEILLIVSIGLCFGMVVLANAAGFSSALGAFMMGSILAETIEGEHIQKLTSKIKDLFGAIFFVSVGMMVNPAIIAQYWPNILVLAIVAVGGILIFSTTGVLIAGKGLDIAVHTGFTMAQLGEFAFIIAGLGCSMGVMREFIYPVVIAVSVITTFSTPYMIKAADPALAYLKRRLPARVLAVVDPPQENTDANSMAEHSEWKKLLKFYALRVGLYSVILVAIILAANAFLDKTVTSVFPSMGEGARGWIELILTLLVMSPFLYGMTILNGGIARPASRLLAEKPSNRWPILSLMALRIGIGIAFIVAVVQKYYHVAGWSALLLVLLMFLFMIVIKFTLRNFGGLEARFMENLNAKENLEKQRAPVATEVQAKMKGYDIHMAGVKLSPDSEYAGKTLREMPFRHTSGVNIVNIVRGSRSILIPSGNEPVYPGDELLAVGTTAQLEAFRRMMEESNAAAPVVNDEEFLVEPIVLKEGSTLAGQTLRSADMRSSGCMVISVLHQGNLITNPKPDYRFEVEDTVWLAGLKSSIEWFK